jgi:hypothetical protein
LLLFAFICFYLLFDLLLFALILLLFAFICFLFCSVFLIINFTFLTVGFRDFVRSIRLAQDYNRFLVYLSIYRPIETKI